MRWLPLLWLMGCLQMGATPGATAIITSGSTSDILIEFEMLEESVEN